MDGGSAFDRLDDLIDRITDRLGELNAGALDLEKLEQLCEDARELNERLIVLRHRARVEKVRSKAGERPTDPRQINLIQAIEHEKAARRAKRLEKKQAAEGAAAEIRDIAAEPPPPVEEPKAAPSPMVAPPVAEADPAAAGEKKEAPATRQEAPFRLMPPPPDKPARPAASVRTSVADKLEHAPIADLGKAIVLSQKFWFINELFSKDASTYEKTIKRINAAGGLEEALTILRTEVEENAKKKPNAEALAELKELIQRRFKT